MSHEAIRAWCQKFGQQNANEVRRRRRPVENKWHLDEVVITINTEKYHLWRAANTGKCIWTGILYCDLMVEVGDGDKRTTPRKDRQSVGYSGMLSCDRF